jgi:hypothetical protein
MVETHKTIFILRYYKTLFSFTFIGCRSRVAKKYCTVIDVSISWTMASLHQSFKITITLCHCISEIDKKKLCQLHTNSIVCNIIHISFYARIFCCLFVVCFTYDFIFCSAIYQRCRETDREKWVSRTNKSFYHLDNDDDVTDTMSISQGMKFHWNNMPFLLLVVKHV